MSRLLAGEVELSVLAPSVLPSGPRSPVEILAVARALAAPDLFLLDAADRVAREGTIACLIRSAAERGERVLVLSPDAAAADRLAESLAADRTIRTVRALADDENPHRPTPAVTRLTSSHAGAGRADQLKREATLTVTSLEAKLSRLDRVVGVRARLEEIERERAAIHAGLESLATEVRAEAEAKREAALAPVEAELATVRAKRSEKQIALEAARANLVQAVKKTGFFARLFRSPKPTPDPTAAEHAIPELERERNDLADRESKLHIETLALAQQFAEESATAIAEQRAAGRARIEPRLKELDLEAARLDLAAREFLPRRASVDDTVENGPSARAARVEVERELAIARTRLQELTSAGPDLARRLLAETQIAIGTPGSLESDPVFKSCGAVPRFDLLVLDHAEELTEPAFERLASVASRCVLAGENPQVVESRPHLNGHGRSSRHRSNAPTLFARLARIVDREPWLIEADRLSFRLVHLNAAARGALAREPVLDHPTVELGVATGADGEPVLAEIAFPANTSVLQAKTFLFSQLGEVLLRPIGERHWQRTADRLTACWPVADVEPGDWVNLEPGVSERVIGGGAAAFTAAIAFDLAAGWDEEKAEAWLAARTPAPSASRLAIIPRDSAGKQSEPR